MLVDRPVALGPVAGVERRLLAAHDVFHRGLDIADDRFGPVHAFRNLRIAIKKLAESNHLPDYRLRFNVEDDKLTVYLRSHKGGLRELKDVLRLV